MDVKNFKVDLSKDIKLEKGQGRAIIATLNVKDHDGDVLLPGVIGNEQHSSILPAHNRGVASMGKAIVREEGNYLVADFKFNLDADHKTAREWHSALKFDRDNGEPVQEWSFALVNIKAQKGIFGDKGDSVRIINKFDIPEISPVLQGASIGTETLALKEKCTFNEQMNSASTSLEDVKAFIERSKSLADLKAIDGKSLSDDKLETLKLFKSSLVEILNNCEELTKKSAEDLKGVDTVMCFAQHQKTLIRFKHLLGA